MDAKYKGFTVVPKTKESALTHIHFVSVLFNARLNGAKYVIPYSDAEDVCESLGDTRLASLSEVTHAFDQGFR